MIAELCGFQMTVEKAAKIITSTNTTGSNRSKQRGEPIEIRSNYLQFAQSAGKNRAYEVWLVFASNWLKNWREISQPITKRSNGVITFDIHLKTALLQRILGFLWKFARDKADNGKLNCVKIGNCAFCVEQFF